MARGSPCASGTRRFASAASPPHTYTGSARAAWLQQCQAVLFGFLGKCSTWAHKSNWTDRRYMRRLRRAVIIEPRSPKHPRCTNAIAMSGQPPPGYKAGMVRALLLPPALTLPAVSAPGACQPACRPGLCPWPWQSLAWLWPRRSLLTAWLVGCGGGAHLTLAPRTGPRVWAARV